MSKYFPALIGSLVFTVIGLVQLKYPDVVRRFDGRMTMLIKDEKTYETVSIAFGAIFLTIGLSTFVSIILYFISTLIREAF